MADFISINNNSTKGNLGISKKVIQTIVDEATNRVAGASVFASKSFRLSSPTAITFTKDGKVCIKVNISIQKGAKADEICLKVQEEIASSVETFTESIPFEIEIAIVDIK